MQLTIDEAIFGQMVGHARAERPLEACGLLAGVGERASLFLPCDNAAKSPGFFTIDQRELLRHFRAIDDAGLELKAVFHSHPSSEAWPSPTDVANAHYPDVVFLILSLAGPEPDLRGFWIRSGRIERAEVLVGPG